MRREFSLKIFRLPILVDFDVSARRQWQTLQVSGSKIVIDVSNYDFLEQMLKVLYIVKRHHSKHDYDITFCPLLPLTYDDPKANVEFINDS